jgi:hypothetical protein
MRKQAPLTLCLLAFLAACGAAEGPSPDAPAATQRLYQIQRAPLFIAASSPPGAASAAAVTADAAVRFARGITPVDRGVRPVEAAAAPILFSSPEGREFLSAPGARGFAIGAPPAACPARASGQGPTAVAAAEASVLGCFARLEAARPEGAGDCGCLVVALGDLILAPPEALSYARGVSARVIAPDFGEDRYFVAEEIAGDSGARVLYFRAAGAAEPGPLAAVVEPDGDAQVLWRDQANDGAELLFDGRHIGDGLRRGRYAERLFVEDPQGRRMTVLIGYEPVEYAVKRRALRQWPRG